MNTLLAHDGDGPQIIHGDCIEVMLGMGDNSVDSIVTDPPYGLGFMGKKWDALPPGQDWAEECLRVLKPGGHLLAFGGTRTWHKLAAVIDDAGFEIRDSLAWMHSEGFPKHRASLKPAFEPVVMARKPFKGTLPSNEAMHGTGSLDIDGCRVPLGSDERADALQARSGGVRGFSDLYVGGKSRGAPPMDISKGRWPANVLLDEDASSALDAVTDIGASRFFYVAKASKRERPAIDGVAHPTVKPLALMRWLVRLVTPAGGTVLDTFAGSGTTIEAALLEGFHCIGIEREAEYLPLIQARIDRAA